MVMTVGVFVLETWYKFPCVGHFMWNPTGLQWQSSKGAKTVVCCTKTAPETPQWENRNKMSCIWTEVLSCALSLEDRAQRKPFEL